jgi:hypothetical protein
VNYEIEALSGKNLSISDSSTKIASEEQDIVSSNIARSVDEIRNQS